LRGNTEPREEQPEPAETGEQGEGKGFHSEKNAIEAEGGGGERIPAGKIQKAGSDFSPKRKSKILILGYEAVMHPKASPAKSKVSRRKKNTLLVGGKKQNFDWKKKRALPLPVGKQRERKKGKSAWGVKEEGIGKRGEKRKKTQMERPICERNQLFQSRRRGDLSIKSLSREKRKKKMKKGRKVC